ncbi:MAG: VCBS repeat-containing protein [Anaerohalosphaeraceae bacterium]
MKALVLVILHTILSSLSFSAVVLSDDFSDNSMSSSWTLYETNHASCWASETSQRLEFRATGSPTSEQVAGYLSNNWKLSPNSNFQMRISYYYSKNTLNDGGLNITISPSTGNYFQVGVGCDENAPYMGYKIVGSMANEQGVARVTNSGAVYLSYDSPSDTLYVSTTGYGSGNALAQIPGLVKGSWGGVNLSVGLFGYSSGVALASGEAYADNFVLDTGTLVYTQYSLNLTKTGNGSIKVDNASHSLPWSGSIAAGSTVTLEAVPDSGWEFTSWSGDKTGNVNPTTILMNGNKNILVDFDSEPVQIMEPAYLGLESPDFNGDGKTDILWRNVNTGVYLFTLMDGLTLGLTKNLGGSNTTLQIAGLADFNADGKTDILWRDVNTGVYRGAVMNGNTIVQIKGLGGSNTTIQIAGLSDLNNDDKTDLIWRNVNTGAYLGTLMDGLTMVQTKGLGGSSTTLQIMNLADLNADGMADLVWRNVNTGAFLGTQMNGLTMVQTKNFGGSSTTLQIVDLADFNNDNKADLVWRNVNTGAYIATQMNGLTMVQNKGLGGSSTTLQIEDLADFNADGMADILWQNVNTGVFLGTQMNGLTLVQTKNFGGSSTTLQIVDLADFNNDNKADLVWRNVNTGSYITTQMNGLTMVQNKGLGGSSTTLQIP